MRASRSAEAGRTTTRSAERDSAMWPISLSSVSDHSVGVHGLAAQRLQAERGDELRAPFGQYAGDRAAACGEQPDQLQRLVGRDAAAHDQQNATAGEAHSRQPEWIAAMPPDRFRTSTRAKPASRIIAASVCWSGNRAMLSAR